jgi:hypothetical protein
MKQETRKAGTMQGDGNLEGRKAGTRHPSMCFLSFLLHNVRRYFNWRLVAVSGKLIMSVMPSFNNNWNCQGRHNLVIVRRKCTLLSAPSPSFWGF